MRLDRAMSQYGRWIGFSGPPPLKYIIEMIMHKSRNANRPVGDYYPMPRRQG